MTGEKRVVPRICDLNYLVASCRGKIEMTLGEEEAAEDKLIQSPDRRGGEDRLRPRTPTRTTTKRSPSSSRAT